MKKIGFIGMGNMAQALAIGFIRSGKATAADLYAFAPNQQKLRENAARIGFVPCTSAKDAIEAADLVILACKPYQIEDVLQQNQEELAKVKKAKESKKDEAVTLTKYVRIGDSKIIYQLDDFSYDVLAACTYDDLRHSQVIWADSDDITQIDVTLEG